MQFAINGNGQRIHIKDADDNSRFFCPYCNAPMLLRKGSINIPHFAHMKNKLCSDNWKYEEMSDWHLSFQANYPEENREVAIINENGRHRADVLINDTVIEFQHSPISLQEFQERNNFYLNSGYKRVIWLFDARDAYQTTLTLKDESTDTYIWKHPPKTLTEFDLYGKVLIFFHLQDTTQTKDGLIIRLTSCTNGDLSCFKSADSEHYSQTEFIEFSKTGTVKSKKNVSGINALVHQVYIIRKRNNALECWGCPVNPDGFAPRIRETGGRITCEECEYCREYSPDGIIFCAGRFRDYLNKIETVLEVEHEDGMIYAFTFINKEGFIQKAEIDPPSSPGKTILQLAKEYMPAFMIVKNIKTNAEFLLSGDIDNMLKKYNKIYGKYITGGTRSKNSIEIRYPFREEWVVTWLKK